ncbi:MAG: hypothetical protein ACLTC8_02075 [Lachnospiraceae bacterium]
MPVKSIRDVADGVAAWTAEHPAAEIATTYDPLFPHHLHERDISVAGSGKEGTVSKNYRGYCANGGRKPLAKGEAKAYLADCRSF